MDIWLFWPSSLPPPPAPRSDGLAAGLQSGASVPQLRAGRVCRPALQLLARLCSPRRWGGAIEDGAIPPSHPPSKKKEDLGLNPDRLPLWHFKGLLSESVKKGSWRLCYFAKMQLAIPSFLLCSCDLFHHLNKYSNCFFSFFFCEEFLFCADGGGSHKSEEAVQFLNKLLSTQYFLQVSPTFHSDPSPSHSFWRVVFCSCRLPHYERL